MTVQETVAHLRAMRASIPELAYSEGLNWYYDLVSAGNDSIANYDYEGLGFMEDWRRDLKRVMIG